MTVYRNVNKYSEHGMRLNRNSGNSGRRRSARSVENIDRVQEALENNPRGIVCRRTGLRLTNFQLDYVTRILLNIP